MTHQRGRLKARRPKLLTADRYLTNANFSEGDGSVVLPAPKYPIDVTEGITNWGMCGNDQWGDCFSAGEYHQELATNAVLIECDPSVSAMSPTASTALDRARAYWGKSVSGPPGPGAVLATFLTWCVRNGYLKAFAPLDRTDRDSLMWFLGQGYGLYCGVSLNEQAEQQFNDDKPWDVSKTDQSTPNDGHCILWSSSQSATGPHGFVTWGKLQSATEAWVQACLVDNPDGEVYVLVTNEDELAPFGPTLLADVQKLATQQSEYEVCQKRGHQPSPLIRTTATYSPATIKIPTRGPFEMTCQHCGTKYHYDSVLVETRP